jgi:hypothetical protein
MKLPLRIRRFGESFIIRDAAGMSICAVDYENEPGRRNSTKRMDEKTAREMAKRIARLLTSEGSTA